MGSSGGREEMRVGDGRPQRALHPSPAHTAAGRGLLFPEQNPPRPKASPPPCPTMGAPTYSSGLPRGWGYSCAHQPKGTSLHFPHQAPLQMPQNPVNAGRLSPREEQNRPRPSASVPFPAAQQDQTPALHCPGCPWLSPERTLWLLETPLLSAPGRRHTAPRKKHPEEPVPPMRLQGGASLCPGHTHSRRPQAPAPPSRV